MDETKYKDSNVFSPLLYFKKIPLALAHCPGSNRRSEFYWLEFLVRADKERLRVLLPQRRVVRNVAALKERSGEYDTRKKVVLLMQQ